MGTHFVEQAGHPMGQSERAYQSDYETDADNCHALNEDQSKHVDSLRAERHPNSDLTSALRHSVSDDSVNTNRRQDHGNSSETSEQQHVKFRTSQRSADQFLHRHYVRNKYFRVEIMDNTAQSALNAGETFQRGP